MSITFYGPWSLTVLSTSAVDLERAIIAGSAASDGTLAGVAGFSIPRIDGAAWTMDMQWSSDGGATWAPSRIRRLPASTPVDGLIITLGADDGPPGQGDGDFNDLVIRLVYLDPVINPPTVGTPPFSFTVPPGWIWPPMPPVRGGAGSGKCCCCQPAGGRTAKARRPRCC